MTGTRAPHTRGAVFGLLAAALFGASAPLAKRLLPEAGPVLVAALFYLGGGAALSFVRALSRRDTEAGLRRADVPLLLAITVLGGIAGPILMLNGLARVSGVAGSLLLNLEAPFTILLAIVGFGEHLGRRELLAATTILGGAALLSWAPGEVRADLSGVLLIGSACLCWAIDNNLSQRLSLRDPIAVARMKTLGAGACTLTVALATHDHTPSATVVGVALVVGALGYGASLALDMQALRLIGAAREAAFFATAPFIGAVLAVPIVGDRVGWPELVAGLLMGSGVLVLVRERHGHEHTHATLEHDHAHHHDEHHAHAHDGEVVEPHAHPHAHVALTHDHPHVSDVHHRHEHG